MKTQKLAKDTHAVGLHGLTHQEIDEGTLPAGTLVRKVQVEETGDGQVTHFQASTDRGEHWYLQRTHGEVELT